VTGREEINMSERLAESKMDGDGLVSNREGTRARGDWQLDLQLDKSTALAPAPHVPREPEERRIWSMDSVFGRGWRINDRIPSHRILPAKERGRTRRSSGRCLCEDKAD